MSDLAARLSEQGDDYRVEARERLAILVPQTGSSPDVERRKEILKLAREEGFTHVALELDPDGARFPGS
jgi:hypothetical protein